MLVENGSEEGMSQDQARAFPGVRSIETGRNLGFSRANNLGIFNSSGDFILLLNSDTRMVEHSLDRMVDYMEKNEDVGALGPREVDGERNYRYSCGAFPNFFSELARKIRHYRFSLNDCNLRDALDMKYAMIRDIDWVSGSCMLLRRQALHDTGLLDENFFMYFEDIDLSSRFWKKEWKVHYLPEASIIHYGGGSTRKNPMLVMTEYRRSEIYFARKYYGCLGEAAVRFFLLLKYASYFLTKPPEFFLRKVLRQDMTRAYATALLAKKVIVMVFLPMDVIPKEPSLKPLGERNCLEKN
ncbi:MAG: glycosyltransferase family 2 protein [Deltaproteobacteria bacterium]